MRSERWNTGSELKRRFRDAADPAAGAGPVVYAANGKAYLDDSESHIAVIGRTGTGKSQCFSLPDMRNCLRKGESFFALDPKGELWRRNACYIPENYQVFCLDFRNPRESPTRWNPLRAPYELFRSENPADHDIACSMVSEFWAGVYPIDPHADAFWPVAAANYAKGLTYATLEKMAGRDWQKDNLVSLAGVYLPKERIEDSTTPAALVKYLDEKPQIKRILLHFDNDNAGRKASLALKTILPSKYKVIDSPPPCGKDYNDFLCFRLGIHRNKTKERTNER